jgi:hypothetical protein
MSEWAKMLARQQDTAIGKVTDRINTSHSPRLSDAGSLPAFSTIGGYAGSVSSSDTITWTSDFYGCEADELGALRHALQLTGFSLQDVIESLEDIHEQR